MSTDFPYAAQDGVLWYPRQDDCPSTITISLYDVRAADGLVIGYDFDRDGYTVARATQPDTEVAFIRSWADFDAAPTPPTTTDEATS